MKQICRKIQDTLAAEGPRALSGDEAAQQHVAECTECFSFLESLSAIEVGLQSLPRPDAPDEVVESLLRHPEIADPAAAAVDTSRWGRIVATAASLLRPRPLVWGSVAAAFLLVVVAVGLRSTWRDLPIEQFGVARNEAAPGDEADGEERVDKFDGARDPDPEQRERLPVLGDWVDSETEEGLSSLKQAGTDASKPTGFYEDALDLPSDIEDADGDDRSDVHGSRSRDFKAVVGSVSNVDPLTGEQTDRINANSIEEMELITPGAEVEFGRAQGGATDVREANKNQPESTVVGVPEPVERRASPPPPPPPVKSRKKPEQQRVSGPLIAGSSGVTLPVLIEDSRTVPVYPELARNARIESQVVLRVTVKADGTVGDATVVKCDRPDMGFEEAAIEAVEQWRYEPARTGGKAVDVYITVVIDFDLHGDETDNSAAPSAIDDAVRVARTFLDERASLENLAFKPANGYWSNTYVPGDPATRLLQARLAGWDRSALLSYLPSVPRLHDASRRVGQPFDAPDASALAVYLHADRRGLAEEGRLLLQVGIEGTPRHGGRRPAMNLALVLDLRNEIPSDVAVGVRSLLEAFNRAKQPGDRFRVFVAGRPGGLVVAPENFRHGFLKVTLDRLIADAASGPEPAPGIVDAVSDAITSVAGADDPTAPLGSSAVILITGRPLGAATRTVAGLAHQGAVAGIPLSVIGIGPEVEPSEIDLVTLAGQGNRRLLDGAAAAADLVDRELSAVSRAIARAVRLRIRLAPGVELIDVLGSERLDERCAQRVRDAEKSIDLRLARNLGIQADRGEDEEGIQIVIPSFYAGDSHVILLDVAAPGPGPVADVTVRYKDLVHLRNGVSRASLDLGRDTRPGGPLEHNVLKNLLSFRLSHVLDEAGRALKRSDAARAAALLDGFAELLEGLRHELPGLDNDPEVAQDLAMLGEYRALIAGGLAGRPEQSDLLADSLCYAARLKLMPRPLETRS
jgi:TonB family protein